MSTWSGRFRKPPDPVAQSFSSSLDVDRRLFREDIEGSLAHVTMLARRGIIPARKASRIRKALLSIRREIESGTFPFAEKKSLRNGSARRKERFVADDIHMAIEQRVLEKIGENGGLLHTARSRNDQVALDERLYLRRVIRSIDEAIRRLQKAVVSKARVYADVLMPGYTHLQRAQPVLLAHHLLAYVSMLERDRGRFEDTLRRSSRSPLGAAALAGTSFPIDRGSIATALGLHGVIENSLDAVSDRDALIEFVAACATTMMHLSRFAEDLVLWSSQEWSFAAIGEAFTTGSSIMPQKNNPDVAELVRGKTGRVYGDLVALLTVMKGLPLAYNRDMQEDKEPLFDAADTVADSLHVLALMIADTGFNRTRFENELNSDFLTATELADFLARKGVPFRKAHAIVGDIVRLCIERKITLQELPLKEYHRHSKHFGPELAGLLDPRSSLTRKRSSGSTSPREVQNALGRWERRLRRSRHGS